MKSFLRISILLFIPLLLSAQQIAQSFGLNLSISLTSHPKSTGASISITYGLYRVARGEEKLSITPAYQLSLNAYLNGLGNKYDQNELNIDIHNSVLLAIATNKLRIGRKDIQPSFHYLNHAYPRNFNIIPLRSSTSFTISSNYIFNFQKRNQLYGSILGQVGKFRIQHYNDGGIIMGNIKIGDDKDRWWTGGTFIEYGNDLPTDSLSQFKRFPQKIRFSFHRFTWDNQEGYISASQGGLEFIPITKDKKEQVKYNSGKYELSIMWNQYQLDIEANNQFKDLQDILHEKGHLAKHPTIAPGYYSMQISKFSIYPFKD